MNLKSILNFAVTIIISFIIVYLGGKQLYIWLIIPFSLIFIQYVVNQYYNYDNANSICTIILRTIYNDIKFAEVDNVRISLLKINNFNKLFQISRVAFNSNKISKTKFDKNKGVAGIALRTSKEQHFVIKDQNFQKDIINNLGFTEEEARLFLIKKEYYCIPIFNKNGGVTHLLSLDSENSTTFNEQIKSRIKIYIPLITATINNVANEKELNEIKIIS